MSNELFESVCRGGILGACKLFLTVVAVTGFGSQSPTFIMAGLPDEVSL